MASNFPTKNGVGHFLCPPKSPIFPHIFSLKYSIPNGNTSVENIPSQLTNLGYNGTAAVSKKGNQVIFSFDLGYGQRQEVGDQQTIFTVPEGYRPNRSLTKLWLTTDGSDTLGYFWRILTDGRITLQSQTAIVGKNAWMVDYFVWNI